MDVTADGGTKSMEVSKAEVLRALEGWWVAGNGSRWPDALGEAEGTMVS